MTLKKLFNFKTKDKILNIKIKKIVSIINLQKKTLFKCNFYLIFY